MSQRQNFINQIAPLVQAENKSRGYPLYSSVVIAQACLETGYGTSKMMMKANAIFGIKAGGSWNGKVYNSKTQEVYNSKPVTITACFRAYDSLADSIKDYFNLICGLSRYKNAIHQNNWVECIQGIYNGGYATNPAYINSIKSIVNSWGLTKYDTYEDLKEDAQNQLFSYSIGKVYTLQVDLNVRIAGGLNFRIKTYNELSPDGKKHAKYKFKNSNAVLKSGTRVTCKGIHIVDGNTWMEIPSGYICAIYNNKIYIK